MLPGFFAPSEALLRGLGHSGSDRIISTESRVVNTAVDYSYREVTIARIHVQKMHEKLPIMQAETIAAQYMVQSHKSGEGEFPALGGENGKLQLLHSRQRTVNKK